MAHMQAAIDEMEAVIDDSDNEMAPADAASAEDASVREGSPEPAARTLKLKSGDGTMIEVDEKVANFMNYVKDMGKDVEFHDGQEIPMGDVSGAILQNVVDFCQFLRDVKNGEYSDAERDQFEADFVAVEVGVLFKMIQASNFLFLTPLYDLTCKTVADILKGMSAENIMVTFAKREEEDDG